MADARQGTQFPDDWGSLGLLIDRSGCFANLSLERVQDGEKAPKRLLVNRAERQCAEPHAALNAERISTGAVVPVLE